MFGPPPLPASSVKSSIEAAWGLALASVEYAPIGYGSYHWHVWSRGGGRWLATLDKEDGRPLVAAYELAFELASSFPFVRGPRVHSGGRVTYSIDGWLLSLWPWLDGDEQRFDEPVLSVVAQHLRRLHDHRSIARVPLLTEDWAIPGRLQLVEALEDRGDGIGPYRRETVARVAANRDTVHDLLDRYDGLVDSVAATSGMVITHGEPNPRNVIGDGTGVWLIDWDTVRWAPRERDLWALGDESAWRDAYGRDVRCSEEALEVYRLQWTLVELADFVPALLEATGGTPDLDVAMREVRSYLPRT